MIYTVTLNPAIDKTMLVPGFSIGAVNRALQVIMDPGGKGINVSKSVKALGGETVCLGIVGGSSGRYICRALDEIGLTHHMVMSENETRTNTKVVDLQLHTNTDINEPGAEVTRELLKRMEDMLFSCVHSGDTVVLAGKNPPGTPDELLADWTKRLRELGVRVCLDTVGVPMKLALREKPFLVKPNGEELDALMGRVHMSVADIIASARELNALGVGLVAVSLGADGAVFVTSTEAVRSYAPKVQAVSTVGAGDSMVAALAHYAALNVSLEELARMATAAASATVTVEGSKPAPMDLVKEMMSNVIVEAC